jgi:RNase P subunit RPR2
VRGVKISAEKQVYPLPSDVKREFCKGCFLLHETPGEIIGMGQI